ncbi:MAG TPA: PKD domain-containing protein [Bacteroidia bacterium]|nr:PKD domain-containing protein [Bacteroidia bacterium]
MEKRNSGGTFQWAKNYGTANEEDLRDAQFNSTTQQLIVTGYRITGTSEVKGVVTAIDPNGVVQFDRLFGFPNANNSFSAMAIGPGYYSFAGYDGTSQIGYLVKTDWSGNTGCTPVSMTVQSQPRTVTHTAGITKNSISLTVTNFTADYNYSHSLTAATSCSACQPYNNSRTVTACTSYFVGGALQTLSGTYRDTLTSIGNCDSIVTTTLTIQQPPTASIAGADQMLCTNTTTLGANTPTTGTGTWSLVSGSGTFVNANSATTTVNGLAIGWNSLVWTIGNGVCTASKDTVRIYRGAANSSSQTASACNSYTWPVNGQTYTTGGPKTATLVNVSGCDSVITLNLTINLAPSQPGGITGSTTVCQGSSNTYTITAVPTATDYTWTLPVGWTGSSTTNSITATAGASSGTITVTANNACGTSVSQSLPVTVNAAPAQPGSLSGNATVCAGSSNTYSIAAVPGATSYTWTLPGGWSGTSTTNSISTTAGSAGGNISVSAINGCGTSPTQTLPVTVTSIPNQPGSISGNVAVCSGTSNIYSIVPVPGAIGYTWTLPGGWSGSSTTDAITAIAGTSGGTILVTADNGCGSSTPQSVAVTMGAAPAQPGAISGATTVCQGSANTYSITAIPGVTSYTWTLPGGFTGSSTTNSITTTAGSTSGSITVVATNGCGTSPTQTLAVTVTPLPTQPGSISGNLSICAGSVNTYTVNAVPGATSYTWTLPGGWSGSSTTNSISATAGTTGGTVSVTASNGCGTSIAQTAAVTVNTAPAQPGSLTGDLAVCAGATHTYSIAAVSGATSYTWTLPGGWSGNSTTNSISTVAGTTGGTISVVANNACGSSVAQSMAVSVIAALPQPGTISGNATLCGGSSGSYSVAAVPGATSYTWTLPGGWSGSSTSNTLIATAGTNGGIISVTANNACGSSMAQVFSVAVTPIPAQPSAVAGSLTLCAGSSSAYSVAPVSGATSYTWTLPNGWTGSSTSNNILVTAGSFSGTMYVVANNACGSSTAQSMTVTVTSTPTQPGAISGNGTVCLGSTTTYSIAPVSGATSYIWTLPGTWSGTSTTNSIAVTVGSQSGTVTVRAVNACGTSANQDLPVTVVPAVSASFSYSSISLTASFTDLTTGATGWAWDFGDGNSSTLQNPVHTYGNPGAYSVCLTASANGCSSTFCNPVTVVLVGMEDETTVETTVFPNPSNGIFQVSAGQLMQAQITDAQGKILFSQSIYPGMNAIDLSLYANGIYFLKIVSGQANAGYKLVKVGN